MRSASIGRRTLPWTLSLVLITTLNGCKWGSDAAAGAFHAPAASYTVGGTVSGLDSGVTFTLLENGFDPLVIAANGAFSFPTALAVDAGYTVTMGTQPAGQTCTVTGGMGTVGTADISNIVVTCSDQAFTLGGTIQGLNASALLLANGNTTLVVPAGAQSFTLPAVIPSGSSYSIYVQMQPTGLACTVNAGSGTMPARTVTDIAITCVTATETVLHSFSAAPGDGAEPWYGSLLLAGDGNFYGLTYLGGAHDGGTAFKMTPAGVETVLWSFGNGNDGSAPYDSLIQASDGNFYGTTNLGGLYQRGTVFKLTPAGVETVLWSFGKVNDGDNPYGSLIQASDGNFYGMTYIGGMYSGYVGGIYRGGTVFKITPAGVETVLWSFGNGNDGNMPYGNLIIGSDGSFYGMTYAGGANGEGIIFKITPAGEETVLWSFGGSGDGAHPGGSLILGTDGNFYGMTIDGGANNAGVIFKFTPGGAETVLHSFGNQGDGFDPTGALIQAADGNFYGMNEIGGWTGRGTIYEITPSGNETVLYSFGEGLNDAASDGEGAFGDLTLGSDGTFYGMTSRGGADNQGTLFSFKLGGVR
jgi:uncharacterized repeat protein (TIGR03803 family)